MMPDNITKAIVRLDNKQVTIEKGDRIRVDDPAIDGCERKIIDSALKALKSAIQEFSGAAHANADMQAEGYGEVYTITHGDTSVSLFMTA
ncbi:MAG: hypothetical protein ABIL58_03290 [Pseudomonadota bacterium]